MPGCNILRSKRHASYQSSAITGSRNYEPYGSLLSSSGEESMSYGYAGEWTEVDEEDSLKWNFSDHLI